MDALLTLDYQVLLWINQTTSNPIFDFILPLMRDKLVWVPLYVFIISFILFNLSSRHALVVLIAVGMTMTVSDLMSSSVIKPSVQRVRPCNDLALEGLITERARCGGGYSFTSSHATNHFALAVFLIVLLGPGRRWRGWLLLWAGTISYAQVYVGVHYPLDILGGSLLGSFIGYWGGGMPGRFGFRRQGEATP